MAVVSNMATTIMISTRVNPFVFIALPAYHLKVHFMQEEDVVLGDFWGNIAILGLAVFRISAIQ